MAGAQSTKSKPSWHVVWCHERCHKMEYKTQKTELAWVLRNAGGTLVCMKQHKQLAMWLATCQKSAYFLLTGWREAKPCISLLGEAGATYQPFRIIVLCDTASQYEKASLWAEQYTNLQVHDVHVCNSAEPLPSLFAALVRPSPGLLVRLPPKSEEESAGSQMPMLKRLDDLHAEEKVV